MAASDRPTKRFTLLLPADLHRVITAIAAAEESTMTRIVLRLLRRGLTFEAGGRDRLRPW